MIFVTVGSALPFDRLVKMIDQAIEAGDLTDEVFGQIGHGRYTPRRFESVPLLSRADYDARFESASAVISHAGIGTISSAIRRRKPLLVLPRNPELGELVDDHQQKTAEAFQSLGHLLMFTDAAELPARLQVLDGFEPKPRQANAAGIADVITTYLSSLMDPTVARNHSLDQSR